MNENRRSPGIGPLSSFKNIIMTRSAKVRDIYLISSKQKYHQIAAVEPEVLKQNTSNLLKERNQYDMFRAKSAGRGGERKSSELKNNTISRNNSRNSKSKTNNKGYQFNKTEDDYYGKFTNNNTIFKKFNTQDDYTEAVDTDIKFDKSDSVKPIEPRAKPNIYETVPRHRTHINRTSTSLSVTLQKETDNGTLETKPDTDTNRKSKSIYGTQTTQLNHRPQTPKIKKSVEMRNNLKLLGSNSADVMKTIVALPKKSPECGRIPSGTNHERKPRKTPRSKTKTKEIQAMELPPQLLHPLWKRIPHRALYGWSEKHQLLETILHKQIAEDRIQSLYYPSEEAFTLDQESSGVRFLQKPIVSSALEVLTLLQYYETSPGALPKPQVVCPGQTPGKEDEGSEDTESGYEGDDE